MSTTTAKASAANADAAPMSQPPARRRGKLLGIVALAVATVTAIASIVMVVTNNTDSTPAPRPAVQQQNLPAGGPSQGQAMVNLDACGRPVIPGRMACR